MSWMQEHMVATVTMVAVCSFVFGFCRSLGEDLYRRIIKPRA